MRWLDKKGEVLEDYKDLNDYELMYMVEENSEDAKEMMYEKYRPMIHKYAKRYYSGCRNCGLEIEDFIQEGYYGVFCAYKTYNQKKDALFYTYVDLCVRSKMYNLVTRNTSLKHRVLNTSISLNKPFDVEKGIDLLDMTYDKNQLLPEDEIIIREQIERFKRFLYAQKIEDASILELYYNGFSYSDIGKLLERKKQGIIAVINRLKKRLNTIEKEII